MRQRNRLISTLAIALGAAPALGATIVQDSFNDGGVSNGADAKDVAWYGSASGVTVGIDPSAITGNTLVMSSASNNRSLHAYFPSVTLAASGDYVELAFDLKYDGPDINSGLTFGLLNSGGTQASSGYAGTISDDSGYSTAINPGGANNLGGGFVGYPGASNEGKFKVFDPGATVHAFNVRYTLNALGGLEVKLQTDVVDGGVQTKTFASPTTLVSDELWFRLSSTGNQGPIYIDNLIVATSVPEPASLSLFAFAAAPLALRRRRG